MAIVILLAFLSLLGLSYGQSSGYSFFFFPEAPITRLESTMIVPSIPPINTGFHAFWPGLEPDNQSFVYQNVIDDDQPSGSWAYSTWYGPYGIAGQYFDYGPFAVSEGDSVYSIFELQNTTGKWIDSYIFEPAGTNNTASNREKAHSGDTTNTFDFEGPLTQALFVIELQGGAMWNFGQLAWQNIIIEAETLETDWCSTPLVEGSFSYSMSTPETNIVGGRVQCYIASLIFESPNMQAAELQGQVAGSSGPGKHAPWHSTGQ